MMDTEHKPSHRVESLRLDSSDRRGFAVLLAWSVAGLVPAAFAVATPALASWSFGPAAPLSPNAALDDPRRYFGADGRVGIATDGQGDVVVIWGSNDTNSGVIGPDGDALMMRSADGGRTWSEPTVLNPDPANTGAGSGIGIATDGAGTWIAAWNSRYGVPDTVVVRSTDEGATWSAPVPLQGAGHELQIASAGEGRWGIVSVSEDEGLGGEGDLVFNRSSDDGLTWSAAHPVGVLDVYPDRQPRLAANVSGAFVVVWHCWDQMRVISSADAGEIWSAPTILGPVGYGGNSYGDVAVSESGRWITVWNANDLDGPPGVDGDVFFSISEDGGTTWSAAAELEPNDDTDGGNGGSPRIVSAGNGDWYVASSGVLPGGKFGGDIDLLFSRSTDNGATWSAAAPLTPTALRDRDPTLEGDRDFLGEIRQVEPGRWIAAWESTYSFEGTIGEDTDIVWAVSQDQCPQSPSATCVPVESRKSSLVINRGIGGRARLKWRWSGGGTQPSDLGDPTVSSDYVLCMYGPTSAGVRAILERDASAGANCSSGACWSALSHGYRYQDRSYAVGAIRQLSISASEQGDAAIAAGSGTGLLGLPHMPLDLSSGIGVQLHNVESGACWSATYSTAIISDAMRFKARSD